MVAASVAALVALIPFARTVELKTYDWRMRWVADPSSARPEIVLVRIDDRSIANLEKLFGRWPWPRVAHAAVVDFLARGPAKVVAYDVLFTEHDRTRFTINGEEWTGEESDRAFAQSVAKAGNVVLVADATKEQDVVASAQSLSPTQAYAEERWSLLEPIPALASAARALGHNFFVLDPDGPVRRHVPFVAVRGETTPSLGVAAYTAAAGARHEEVARQLPIIEDTIPDFEGGMRRSRRVLINFRGPAALSATDTTYKEYSAVDLMLSEDQLIAGEKPFLDPSVFKDKIVVVGATAAGLHDLFTVPFEHGGKMPGMQIHAAVIDDLLSSRSLRPAPAGAGLLLTILGALIAGVLASRLSAGLMTVSIAATLSALAAFATLSFARGVWLPAAQPALAIALAGFGGVTYQYVIEGREKRKVKQIFSRFVPRDVFRQLMADPSRARLGGERRQMSVLFCDIRGFTSESEKLQPEAVVGQLNEYFSAMVEVIFGHQGTVDKFVGDMVMALFGAPLPDPDHADHAVAAALDMIASLDRLNRRWRDEGRPVLNVGVGINSGDMVAGNIGSVSIMSYTVIGDAVNLASRLESLNKDFGTTIIVSEHTRALLKRQYNTRPLGSVTVKGRAAPVEIFEVQR